MTTPEGLRPCDHNFVPFRVIKAILCFHCKKTRREAELLERLEQYQSIAAENQRLRKAIGELRGFTKSYLQGLEWMDKQMGSAYLRIEETKKVKTALASTEGTDK